MKYRKRKVGAQPGNQNARKHGYYSKVRTRVEQEWFPDAVKVDGLDTDIAILRIKVRSILANDPRNAKALAVALTSLSSLHRARRLVAHQRAEKARWVSEMLGQLLSIKSETAQPQKGPC